MARSGCFSRRLGVAVRELKGAWYGRHMAASERAIVDRLPIVDVVLEIRDARLSIVLRDKIRELKSGQDSYTATVMLVGIPNVGKSAIANSLHEIGRIHAEEKGRHRHAVVSTFPGETKDITAYKMQSHPSIYVLDTPGVLSPIVATDDYASKLALTGAIKDSTLQDGGLVEFFLFVLNFSGKYNSWEDSDDRAELVSQKKIRKHHSDHTNDVIVKDVRRTLAKIRHSFNGDLEKEDEHGKLIESQLVALQKPFGLHCGSVGDRNRAIASKLLDLYWTGRLGHYTLDTFSNDL
ncbi:P-loop containing nucleoside triphosphate hydrolases superfamily protein isoform X2 [Carex rostrata]